jgi:hypothetical protein
VDSSHEGSTPKSVSTLQWLFNIRNKLSPINQSGKSIISGKPTKWDEKHGRYERLADDKEKEEFRKIFLARMRKKYNKDTLLNDADVQKKMMASRSISGVYEYSDGTKFQYTGSYELDFIRFMDANIEWESKDIFMPCPFVIPYTSPRDNKEHFYIPDVLIESKKIVIEIKSSENKHYRERDKDIENAKDEAMKNTNMRFVKIFDKDYSELSEILKE